MLDASNKANFVRYFFLNGTGKSGGSSDTTLIVPSFNFNRDEMEQELTDFFLGSNKSEWNKHTVMTIESDIADGELKTSIDNACPSLLEDYKNVFYASKIVFVNYPEKLTYSYPHRLFLTRMLDKGLFVRNCELEFDLTLDKNNSDLRTEFGDKCEECDIIVTERDFDYEDIEYLVEEIMNELKQQY